MDRYNPSTFEQNWYQQWEEAKVFEPSQSSEKPSFSIVIPPPNVTGSLHIGHAMEDTLMDIITRWKRMKGFSALWLPGMDHAGIATQVMVERKLAAEGKTKEDLGREAFEKEIWDWKENSGGMILKQLRRLGASVAWSKERFTMDEGLSKAVKKCFVSLYNEGLIYRGDYLVNWCPKDKTALSDLEVNYIEIEGEITHLLYPLEDGSGHIEVATTRPETMLGDTAVAVNPADPRYQNLIGKKIKLPLVNRLIPIIADEHCDMEFGTGAVKVTPAHDPNDFEIGKRHNLEMINVLTEDGKINNVFPELEGTDRFEARKMIIQKFDQLGLLKGSKKHVHSVGHSQRSATIVEPRLSTQWFCKMKEMANAALNAQETGKIKFIPENQGKIFREWLTNIQDWCISRQLWWGHQIPAWHCQDCNTIIVSEETPTQCNSCNSSNLKQEKDVLDTWFSSGLFPFSTMGWPDETAEDFKKFYPNSTLITGYDILFFWVARMIMMGIKLTGEVPFPEVYLHGLVRDENNEKMSKTKGNVVDPLEVIEEFGADPLRFTLASLTSIGRDIKFSKNLIETNRNFINKFWNATKFTLQHLERLGKPKPLNEVRLGEFDNWILSELNRTIEEVELSLKGFRFNDYCKALYHFVWHQFCDWYVEIIKPMLFSKLGHEAQEASLSTLVFVLESLLKLTHPVMPFVTEEIWSNLPTTEGFICTSVFPSLVDQVQTIKEVSSLIDSVEKVRNIRGESNINPGVKLEVFFVSSDQGLRELTTNQETVLLPLMGAKELNVTETFAGGDGFAKGAGVGFEVFVNLKDSIDVEAERKRLNKEIEKLSKKASQLESKLNNQQFLAKAPQAVVDKNKVELKELQEKVEKLESALKQL